MIEFSVLTCSLSKSEKYNLQNNIHGWILSTLKQYISGNSHTRSIEKDPKMSTVLNSEEGTKKSPGS